MDYRAAVEISSDSLVLWLLISGFKQVEQVPNLFLCQAFLKTKCAECAGSCGLAKKYKETMAAACSNWPPLIQICCCPILKIPLDPFGSCFGVQKWRIPLERNQTTGVTPVVYF